MAVHVLVAVRALPGLALPGRVLPGINRALTGERVLPGECVLAVVVLCGGCGCVRRLGWLVWCPVYGLVELGHAVGQICGVGGQVGGVVGGEGAVRAVCCVREAAVRSFEPRIYSL